ncbi:MAG: hypothetical protein VX549_15335 [Pseudomonadota bacterium]|nr:hypothetical protein [Pseudomonadota bacterium]
MNLLQGIAFSIPMFFRPDESIDWPALEAYLDRIAPNAGVACLYSMAFNTRYQQLSVDEIHAVNRLTCEAARDKGVPAIVGHPIGQRQVDLLQFCERAAQEYQPDAISVLFPERYFGQDDPVLAYLQTPVRAGLSCFIHQMKLVSGFDGSLVDWPQQLLDQALGMAGVVGMKEDSKDDGIARDLLARFGDTHSIVIAGGGKRRAAALAETGQLRSWLNGSLMLDSGPAAKIYDAIITNDAPTVQRYLDRIEQPYFDQVVSALGWHVAHKLALEVAGYGTRHERSPMTIATDAQRDAHAETLERVIEALREFSGSE